MKSLNGGASFGVEEKNQSIVTARENFGVALSQDR
jgi:hypothetical protein